MEREMDKQILKFIESNPRHRLVVCDVLPADVYHLDMGLNLSRKIVDFCGSSNLAMLTQETLTSLMDHHIARHAVYGKSIAIMNCGILFEPELHIDFRAFIEKWSKSCLVFLHHENVIPTAALEGITYIQI